MDTFKPKNGICVYRIDNFVRVKIKDNGLEEELNVASELIPIPLNW